MSDNVVDGTPADADADGGQSEDYSEREDRLAVYEYIGMLTATLGFFVPLLSRPVAGYCAHRIRNWKPITALLVVAVALTTVVFWILVVMFVIQPPFVSNLSMLHPV